MKDSIGPRLVHARGADSQAAFAPKVGIHKNTLGKYERGEREIGAEALGGYVALGWNANWLLTGVGRERTADEAGVAAVSGDSQPMRSDSLRIAITLAEKALDGRTLSPDDYGELVTLIYEALVNGLPSAQVLAFARPAARGLSQGDRKDEAGQPLGGKGRTATGEGR